jgi:hypothetical protein
MWMLGRSGDGRCGPRAAVRLDEEEAVGGADDRVGTGVQRRDDELPAPAPVPFDLEGQPHAAVDSRAFAPHVVRGIRARGQALALPDPGTPGLPQRPEHASTLAREHRTISLVVDRLQAHDGRSGERFISLSFPSA